MAQSASQFRAFIKRNFLYVEFGLITGMAIVFFDVINLFVVYRYLKMDYYLSLVAIIFLSAGLLINKTAKPRESASEHSFEVLTAKEIQILCLIGEGKSNKEIASIHFIELSTVKTHINNIYCKLSISSRREARLKYIEWMKRGPAI